jgi:hypothetical protein
MDITNSTQETRPRLGYLTNGRPYIVKYPIFESCKDYTIQPYWLDQFGKMASGEFPKYINSFEPSTNALTFAFPILDIYGSRTVTFSKSPQPNSALGMYRLIKKYLNYFGVCASNELPKASFPPLFQYSAWKYVKSKSTREELISQFVDATYPGEPHKFSEIISLIQTKRISDKDIHMDENGITHIDIPDKDTPTSKIDKTKFLPYEYSPKKNPLVLGITQFSNDRIKRIGKCTSDKKLDSGAIIEPLAELEIPPISS